MVKVQNMLQNEMNNYKKPTLMKHKDGKNCYEKETTCFQVVTKFKYIFLIYENISFTFSKKDLSPFSGLGAKFSSFRYFSKN